MMNTIKLTTKQFNEVLKTLPLEPYQYQAEDDPVRCKSSNLSKPRYFEHDNTKYVEDFDKNIIYNCFLVAHDQKDKLSMCIEQMYSKGFISAEDFRAQLCDVIPEMNQHLYDVLYDKGMVKTKTDVDKLLQSNTLVSSEILPLLVQRII